MSKKTSGGWSVLAEGGHLMLFAFGVAADSRWIWTVVLPATAR